MEPTVSVIIPTFNYGNYIGECTEALLSQKFGEFEAIIVDDCSTDGTFDKLHGNLPDERFRIHRQDRNQGASVARNTGVGMARGEYIVFVDADDLLLPGHLETVVRLGRALPSVALICCDCQLIGPTGSLLHGGRTWHSVLGALTGRDQVSGMRSLSDIFHFSHCFTGYTVRREVYQELGGMDQSLFPLDDYDFMLRLAGQGRGVYYSDEVLALRRDHDVNCSGVRNSVKVGRKKLECLRLALSAHPELRASGRGSRARFAEVLEELAISHFYGREWARGLLAVTRCLAHDPRRLARLSTLAGRRLTRPRTMGPPVLADSPGARD
ncbi:MAG: glycosyltransferase [Isosphaeraceae bacterium]|nr:glycosyltransferase [Isosphaeraceae bacterium]